MVEDEGGGGVRVSCLEGTGTMYKLTVAKSEYVGGESNTVEPGYNNIGLCDASPITWDILWYQLVPHC
jgi:hypothetical protein